MATSATRPHAVCGGARCRRVALLAAAVLLAALVAAAALAAGADAGGTAEPVYLLNAMYSPNTDTANVARAVWLGIDAALHHAGYTAVGGRPVHIVSPKPGVDPSDIVAVVEAALADYPSLLGAIGPYSDPQLMAVMNSTTVRDASLMLLAPFTGSSVVRTWNPNVYFTRAEPRLEVMAIVKHIANTIRARRTAFMYLTGVAFGDTQYTEAKRLLRKVSMAAPALYTAAYSNTSGALDRAAFDAMADTRPQVVIVWGVPGQETADFLRAVLTDPRTSAAHVISSFMLQQLAFQVYYDLAMAGTITPVGGQMMASATAFPMTMASLTTHIPMFAEQMNAYMQDTGNVDASLWADEAAAVAAYGGSWPPPSAGTPSPADVFLHEHPSVAQLMLTGWISGTLITQTLMQPSYVTSAAAYQAGLFEQHRYVMGGDFVLCDYGGPCGELAQLLAAVCYCNQGGHAAFVQTLSNASWSIEVDSGVNYSQNDCYSTGTDLPSPLNFLTLVFDDDPALEQAGIDFTEVMPRYTKYAQFTASRVNFITLHVTDDTAASLLETQISDYTTDVISSTLTTGVDVHGYLVPSPLFARPRLVQPRRNFIYLMPTLEQQIFLLYLNLATVQGVTSVGSRVHVVLRGYDSGEATDITAMLQKSAATFDHDDPTVASVAYAEGVYRALVGGCINVILGMTTDDVGDVSRFLAGDPAAIVVVPFDDLLLQYPAVVDALTPLATSVQARLLSFSSLPLWSDTSAAARAASPLLAQFFGAFPDPADHTPGKLLGVLVASLLMNLVSAMGRVNTTLLVDNIYLNGVMSVYGTTLGTFDWSCTDTMVGSSCTQANYGAQFISMLSVHRMLDPSVPQLTPDATPSLVYTPRGTSGLTAAQRSGIIAGCVVGGVLLIVAVVLLVCCCRDSRDNDAAPKEDREPVTLIFTDIESSTAMWAALPQLMADAIAAHHRVIRQLIRKHGCYEVKTIGDSFMIACGDAYSAVQLACDIQTRLLAYDWGTTRIDSAYRDFELAKADSAAGYVPPTARLSEEEYAALWRGLRVRIGIHTGLSDIRYDEVTRGYDYYGDTSNMAARTGAVANGGQVVATETTWWALSDQERDATAHTAFGPQGLRGVPYAVEMYQLNAVPGRKHAALRTEIEAILPDDTATETGSSAAGALLSSAGTMTGAAASVAVVLSSAFALYPVSLRLRELQPLLNRWNIGAPPRSKRVSEEDYCTGLMNRLAVRVAAVAQARQRLADDVASTRASLLSSAGLRCTNPLTDLAGSLADDGEKISPLPTHETAFCRLRSATRESRLQQRASGEASVSVVVSRASSPNSRRVRRSSAVGWQDAVVPFTQPVSQDASVTTVVVGAHRVGGGAVWDRDASSTTSGGGPAGGWGGRGHGDSA